MKDFKNITYEIIDVNINSFPDMYVNRNGITFSKKVLEDLNYSANVQYFINTENKVFAVRACKGNDSKSMPFSKTRSEQTGTLSTSNKNLVESIKALMSQDYNSENRYKITGHFDSESRTIYYDMEEFIIDNLRQAKSE